MTLGLDMHPYRSDARARAAYEAARAQRWRDDPMEWLLGLARGLPEFSPLPSFRLRLACSEAYYQKDLDPVPYSVVRLVGTGFDPEWFTIEDLEGVGFQVHYSRLSWLSF